jgi:hypothetical protein
MAAAFVLAGGQMAVLSFGVLESAVLLRKRRKVKRVDVRDTNDQLVFWAIITMWVSSKS